MPKSASLNRKNNLFLRLLNRFAPAKNVPRAKLLRESGDFDEFVCTWGNHVGSDLNSAKLRRMLVAADEGNPGDLALLFRRILESEPGITAHIQTRILAVLACDWSVVSQEYPERAEETGKILASAGMYDLLQHLLSAIAYGYAAAAIIWDEGGGAIRSFRCIDPANLVFDRCENPALLTVSGTTAPLAAYHENQFVFHRTRLALLRPLVWLYFFKHYAMRDRARYLERFGIPFIAAKIRNEDFESEEVRNELMQSLSRLGADGVGLLNEGADVQIVSPSGNASGDYQAWLDYLDGLAARLILGQTATSSSGSGFSTGSVQDKVRRDLIEADCRALMETVDRQILAPLERFRYGTEGTIHFKMDCTTPENLLEKAQIVEKLTSSGVAVCPEWIEKTFGVRILRTRKEKTEQE